MPFIGLDIDLDVVGRLKRLDELVIGVITPDQIFSSSAARPTRGATTDAAAVAAAPFKTVLRDGRQDDFHASQSLNFLPFMAPHRLLSGVQALDTLTLIR